MNKTFFIALMLASGMALAQSSGSYGSQNQSQPSGQQSQPSTQPSQPSTQQNPSSSQNPTSSGPSSLTGCLKGSDGSWVIVSQGQSTPVTGDTSKLSPHNGHQVQLNGSPASDGSFQVTDITMISETCPTQQSDASSGAAAAAGATAGAVRTVAQQTSSGAQSNPQSTSPSSTQSTSPASGQNTNQSTTPSTTQSTQPSGSAGQTSTDQTGAQKKLPQTASPLPLLGLLGFGSLVTGLIARRKK